MSPFLLLINVSLTFCWTFLDIFIMITGIAIATRFTQITERIRRMEKMMIPNSFWTEVRTHYLILNELVLYVDDRLSLLILLSCASNLYFICLQLLNSFTNNYTNTLSTVYFWFSLFFVMGRTVCVLLCAASIHDSSKTPLKTLRNVPTRFWSVELGRFIYTITKDTIALSGRRFFYLTKRLVLAMAATVATYELVVYDQVTSAERPPDSETHPCNWTHQE
ncbi:gustatory receptor for sugar taste 64a-like [Phlebotomus argentipes]|uniref:gustatory receptor for sugar taste 64a-like n=1 Tax=Phlebotomus argentipes TaxID=94469 RepID=UPI002892F3EE|nr:gustatory receptor for sugar taste 64a-like [Phlebotomus argentipes]